MGKNYPPDAFFSSSFFSAAITTVHYASANDENTPRRETVQIPIDDASHSETSIQIPVRLPQSLQSAAAARIQAAYRSRRVRALVREISAVNSEADRYERLLRQQDTVDSVRRDRLERLRLNEGLMSLLLRLDSVPGIDPVVRELRRRTSHRIVALQEVLDAVVDARVDDDLPTFPPTWDEFVAGIGGEWEGDGGEDELGSCARAKLEFLFLILWDAAGNAEKESNRYVDVLHD
ncbi:hypothetical protein ACLOJK_032734 [Asimina triloba]